MANSKNKKIAEKAERQAKEMKTEIDKLRRIDAKVLKEIDVITPLNKGISLLLDQFLKLPHRDYKRLYADEKDLLLQLVNSSESLSKGIARKIE